MTISMDNKTFKQIVDAVHPTYANDLNLLAKIAIAKEKAELSFPLDVGYMTILFEVKNQLFLGAFSANAEEYNFRLITDKAELKDLCDRHYHSSVAHSFHHLVK